MCWRRLRHRGRDLFGLELLGIAARCRQEGGVVFLDRDPDGRDSTLDQVVGLEIVRPDLAPVDPRPVGACQVQEPALGRIHFDQEMVSREVLVLNRQLEVRSPCPGQR